MNRLIYIANCRMPSETAHSLQIMKMCEAFVEASGNIGIDITLLLPSRRTSIKDDPFKYYGISDIHKKHIDIHRLWSLDLFGILGKGKLPFWIHAITYSISVLLYVRKNTDAKLFSRDPISSFLLLFFGHQVCYEVHDTPGKNLRNKWFFSRLKKIVVTNEKKFNELITIFGIQKEKILLAHNGVNLTKKVALHTYANIQTYSGQTELTKSKRKVLYTGSLKSWKGVETLAMATRFLPDEVLIIFVGDTHEKIRQFKRWIESEGLSLEQMNFMPHLPYTEIPKYWADADVLVVPNTAKEKISLEETSPIKLFEGLASGRLIVASDLPSIREVTKHAGDKEVLIFAKPDDPKDWAEKIMQALNLPDEKKYELIDNAYKLAIRFTWEGRASIILDFLKLI